MHSEATFQPFQVVCKYLGNASRSTHDKKSCGFPPTSFFIASSYGFGILQDPPISYSMESVAYRIWLVEAILLWARFFGGRDKSRPYGFPGILLTRPATNAIRVGK